MGLGRAHASQIRWDGSRRIRVLSAQVDVDRGEGVAATFPVEIVFEDVRERLILYKDAAKHRPDGEHRRCSALSRGTAARGLVALLSGDLRITARESL